MRNALGWNIIKKWNLGIVSIAVLIAIGGATIMTFAVPGTASAASEAPSGLTGYLSKKVGKDVGVMIMESMGYTCYAATVFSCYMETSYDPPRWFYYGVVETGNGPSGYVRARGWPSTSAPVIQTYPEGWKLVIFCQTTGPWVYGRWGWTNVWDYVGHRGEATKFVSDGFVRTGSNGFVAGDCGATGMGGNK